jgi:hypothetical protein
VQKGKNMQSSKSSPSLSLSLPPPFPPPAFPQPLTLFKPPLPCCPAPSNLAHPLPFTSTRLIHSSPAASFFGQIGLGFGFRV